MPKMRMDGNQFVILDDELDVVSRHRKVPGNAVWHWIDICSVPHTGTNFLHQLISSAGFQCRTGHTFKENGIAPIRDPWETYVSWVSRGKDTDGFEAAWKEFDEAYRELDLFIVPIDTKDRELHLSNLERMLKVELPTDWAPVESEERVKVAKKALKRVYDLPLVKKFYGKEAPKKVAKKAKKKVVKKKGKK